MAVVIFLSSSDERQELEVLPGLTAMEAALHADVEAIDGECGGAGICGTCHVWVDEAWIDRLPAPAESECDMLEGLENRRWNSRLSCQIKVTADLDGLLLRTPPADV